MKIAKSVAHYMLPVGMLLVIFQIPIVQKIESSLPVKTIYKAVADVETIPIAEAFFGDEATSTEAQSIIDKQEKLVTTRDAYPAAMAVVVKHEDTIKTVAEEKNVPEDVAIGVAFLENGGSDTAKSPAGAMGVYQLMPGTARNLGLEVSKEVDERKNPEQNIEAGITYLSHNYELFGDWGLATWAYHAGEGNVTKALKIYAKENDGIELKGLNDPEALKDYVVTHGINIHKLLTDPKVKEFADKLNDDSSGYPYKVIATATLYKNAGNKTTNEVTVR